MDSEEIILIQRIAENIYDSSTSSSSDETTSSSSRISSDNEEEIRTHHRVQDFMETIKKFDDTDFKRNFRLSRSTANIIIETYKSSEVLPTYKSGCENVGGEKETYMFLWYVANSITYRQLGNLFDVCDSTAWTIVNRMSAWLVSIADRFIKWPRTPNRVQEITSGFEKMKGISGVLGAIDGTHIKIKAPSDQIRLYTNRKRYCSIIMQAVVDHDKKFIDIHCGEPGSFHDSRVLRRSLLFRKAADYESLFPNNTFLLGDCAYGSKRWLVTPFKDTGNLTEQQHKYNYLHSATRMVIENAFGLLKTRFRRILHFTEHSNISTVINITIACCVLHNLCLNEQDEWSYSDDDNEDNNLDDLTTGLPGSGTHLTII